MEHFRNDLFLKLSILTRNDKDQFGWVIFNTTTQSNDFSGHFIDSDKSWFHFEATYTLELSKVHKVVYIFDVSHFRNISVNSHATYPNLDFDCIQNLVRAIRSEDI